jgi:hypothetical protein
MADDQVRIDPQFSPPPPGDGPGRLLRIVAIVAVAIAAFAYGWLLRSPSPGQSEQDEASVTSSTTSTEEDAAASTTTRRPTATATELSAVIGFEVPLEEALPGFTDTITMTLWDDAGMDVVRWRPSEPAAETIASLHVDQLGFYAGLDASGNWYSSFDENGVLSVRALLGAVAWAAAEHVDEPWEWPSAFYEAIAVRVVDAVWHETDPGRLAWLTCWSAPSATGTIHSLDVADGAAEPVLERSVEGVCDEDPGAVLGGWGRGTWFEGWSDWGFALGRWENEAPEFLLVTDDPSDVVSIDTESGDTELFAGTGGTILRTGLRGSSEVSFLRSSDGQHIDPVPGLAGDEWVDDALWSQDGSLLALSLRRSTTTVPMIRIVEVSSGAEIAEIVEPEGEVSPMVWSTDGRFLLCARYSGGSYEAPVDDDPADSLVEWVVYDIETGHNQSISVPEGWYVGEIRLDEAESPAEHVTAVDWGIAIDGAQPGVHIVDMVVDARPLAPDQVDAVSGRLVWDETVVDLCRIEIRDVGVSFVHVGDIFGTDEGCGDNPTAMQDAFDEFGLPETACVEIRAAGVDHEYCAPLS